MTERRKRGKPARPAAAKLIPEPKRQLLQEWPFHRQVDRWMLFVDGENFTIRGQELAALEGFAFVPGVHFEPDVFLWPPLDFWSETIGEVVATGHNPVRSYYYTSIVGDDQRYERVEEKIWKRGFSPVVFRKAKRERKSKGVDIALTKDVLSHGFAGHYDLAVLVAGDADYVPLVEEVKRMGKVVYVAFHEDADVQRRLRIAADLFVPIPLHRMLLETMTVAGETLEYCRPLDTSEAKKK